MSLLGTVNFAAVAASITLSVQRSSLPVRGSIETIAFNAQLASSVFPSISIMPASLTNAFVNGFSPPHNNCSNSPRARLGK